jgi:hypothetical protein
MKTFIAVLIIGFAVAGSLGQDRTNGCPTLSMEGPAGIVAPGEVATFIAHMSGPVPYNIKYSWAVSEGEILSGQDGASVEVMTPKPDFYRVVATVKVIGLPANCPYTASETYTLDREPVPEQIDEYGAISLKAEMTRLKRSAEKLKDHSYSQLYLIIYPSEEEDVQKRIDRLKRYSDTVTPDPNQLTVVIGPVLTKPKSLMYIVPPGSDDPQP